MLSNHTIRALQPVEKASTEPVGSINVFIMPSTVDMTQLANLN